MWRPAQPSMRDFRDLQRPGSIQWSVSDARNGQPLDARISIERGQKPLVEFLGREHVLHRPRSQGPCRRADRARRLSLYGVGGRRIPVRAAEGRTCGCSGRCADGKCRADAAVRSAGAALVFGGSASSRRSGGGGDPARGFGAFAAGRRARSVVRQRSRLDGEPRRPLQAIAARRGVAFIPSIELSASWGHFNAYPLSPGQELKLDTGTATIDDILKEGRRLGATVVQVNHPFIPYGYFTSVAAGVAPGGFNPAFDLIEINAAEPADDVKVLQTLWSFWNAGHRYYLTAGTDTHDVWHAESGSGTHLRSHRRRSDRPGIRAGAEGGPRLRDVRPADVSVGDVRR